jgi:hypothetical protein
MAEWNVSTDRVTLQEKPPRRSPLQWVRDHSIRIAFLVGVVEGLFAWINGFRWLFLVGLAAVFAYLWLRNRVPLRLRRPLWVLAMSQAVAAIVVPALGGLIFLTAMVAALVLVILVLVMLGDLRRT